MARFHFLKSHRSWEDRVGALLGLLVAASPLFAAETTVHAVHSLLELLMGKGTDHAVTLNSVVVGMLVLVLAVFQLAVLSRWQEVIQVLCGAWLIASPFVFGYAGAGQLRWWHFSLGALVTSLAVFELWQDWDLSDEDLARHGR